MGQGFSLATPSAGVAGIDVPALSDLIYEKSLGEGRFMKSVRARHRDGVVLVKILVKPYTVKLDNYKQEILRQRQALSGTPNVLPFERVVETETNGYLVRQFMYSSLYDRLSTRPFLEDVEKKWLAFQLLCALRDCHAQDIYHGDIKAHNVLVTSWNWLYLSDFSSSFKPVVLPDNLPADFTYYFDTSGRRTCYLAPERFVTEGQEAPAPTKVTWAMDMFSAGCVIAQMFLESEIFNLSQLYSYKQGKYDPVITHLSIIADRDLREMITHMIQLDPEKRYSAEHYLKVWRGKVFPDYFYSFLHGYMDHVTNPSSGVSVSGATRNLGEPDERIDLIYHDFDKISFFLGHRHENRQAAPAQPQSRLGLGPFPVRLSIPGHEHAISDTMDPPEDDGTLIFLAVVLSSLRNAARAGSKIKGCDLLLAFSERLTDEAKLDRVLPYFVSLLNDDSDMVVTTAIRSIAQLLRLVRIVTPINSHIFPDYIMPRLEAILRTKAGTPRGPLVRQTYAACLGSLALTALRFLEATGGLKAHGLLTLDDPELELGLDADGAVDTPAASPRRQLLDIFEMHAKALVEDGDVFVRRAFLASVPDLCVFFAARSNDILLSHLNTYLNDRDWILKCAFFETIVGIATLLGSVSLEEFILPLMLQALTDPEEYVVREVLHSLAQLARLGLFSRAKVWELVDLIARFTMHPNPWLREAAAEFLSSSSHYLTPADVRCILFPLARPFLKAGIVPDFDSELAVLDALQRPLTRAVFEQAIVWAQKTDRGVFWKPSQQNREFTLRSASRSVSSPSAELVRLSRNDEDDQWLSKLRSLGLGADEEFKLVALREFVWRLSIRRSRDVAPGPGRIQSETVVLQSLGVMPQTVLLYQEPPKEGSGSAAVPAKAPYTIADALMDASMAIDDAAAKRKRTAVNQHKSRLAPSSNGNSTSNTNAAPSPRLLATSPTGTRGGSSRDSSVADDTRSSKRSIRHQSSALSLLDRRDSNKTAPETSTTSTNAVGQVESGPFTQPLAAKAPKMAAEGAPHQETPPRTRHTYEGHNPSIIKMLNAIALDTYPTDLPEFGPLVTPVTGFRTTTAVGSGGKHAQKTWQPKGGFVATFAEHKGAINRVVASPDHVFFITGGDDGTVRVWDSSRLERNITHRSKQVYRHGNNGGRVVALCFVEATHTFISASTDGSVHLVRVDIRLSHDGTLRYGRLQPAGQFLIGQADEHAVWVEHFKTETHSIMMLATNRSRIMAVNLRNMEVLYELRNPVHHGTPTCFCIDRRRHWLCVGTSHGVLDLWDLRFHTRLKAMGLPGRTAVYRLSVHPARGRGRWICVAGGCGPGEVTIWDIERSTCREVLRPSGSKELTGAYEFWDVDGDKPEGMLSRFATAIEPATDTVDADGGVRAMLVGSPNMVFLDDDDDDARSKPASADPSSLREVRGAFVITAGADKKLRFWDLQQPYNSTTFSGLRPEDPRPVYATAQERSPTIFTERVPRAHSTGSGGGGSERRRDSRSGDGGSVRPTTSGRGASSRSMLVSVQQQTLMRGHLDAITDVAVLDVPYSVVVSVDRLGVIFVFR